MIKKRYSLTKSQREILYVSEKNSLCSQSFNESILLSFPKDLNVDRMEKAISFIYENNDIFSVILDQTSQEWIVTDKPLFFERIRIEETRDLLTVTNQINDYVYNLSKDPLIRFYLIEDPNTIHFCIHGHHILIDGFSQNLLINKISQYYSSPELNPDPVQYTFDSLNEILDIEDLDNREEDEGISFWRTYLQNNPIPEDLPWCNRIDNLKHYEGNTYFSRIKNERFDKIIKQAESHNLSIHNFLFALWFFVKERLTNDESQVIGYPVSSQNLYGLHNVFGNAVNLIPLKFSVNNHLSREEYFLDFKKQTFNILPYAGWTYQDILEHVSVQRSSDRNPLFEMMFNYSPPSEKWNFDSIPYRESRFRKLSTNFDIYVNCRHDPEGLCIAIDYNSEIYTEEAIKNFYSCFDSVLNQFCEKHISYLHEISLLSKEESFKICKRFQGPEKKVHRGLSEILYNIYQKYSDKKAIISQNSYLTYGDLSKKTSQLGRLLHRNYSEYDKIGLALSRTPNLILAMLGILRTGKAYIPLDLDFPEDRLRGIKDDSGLQCIISDEKHREKAASIFNNCEIIIIEDLLLNDQSSEDTGEEAINVDLESIAYILYTSGSTGVPKGVVISHGNLVNFLQAMKEKPRYRSNDFLLALTTISFDISGLELFLPLFCGGTLYIASKEEQSTSEEVLKLIEKIDPSIIQGTPALWKSLLYREISNWSDKKILCGGEALEQELACKILQTGAELWNMYGPTETTIWSSCCQVTDCNSPVPLGVPIDNTDFFILDNWGNTVPSGVSGELYIAGKGVGFGYYNKPELTYDKFKSPIGKYTERVFQTGDSVVQKADGEIYFLGRLDNQLKIRGFRIEAGDIESVLCSHKFIKDTVVLKREDQFGNAILIAYYLSDVDDISILELREFLKDRLPEYMIPNNFMKMDNFPLTPNLKINRKNFPDYIEAEMENIKEDISDFQERVKKIWQNILGISNFSINANFFDIGGHSILINEMKRQIDIELASDISLVTFFQYPTIRLLSENLKNQNNRSDQLMELKHHLKTKRARKNGRR